MRVRIVGQKAPSANRCIKTRLQQPCDWLPESGVKMHRAPKGALRRLPPRAAVPDQVAGVRKHRAPKGALRLLEAFDASIAIDVGQKAPSAKRCIKTDARNGAHRVRDSCVRKHQAPKGALRRQLPMPSYFTSRSQKAPSAKRCIKTGQHVRDSELLSIVRKHRAPKGALRQREPSP